MKIACSGDGFRSWALVILCIVAFGCTQKKNAPSTAMNVTAEGGGLPIDHPPVDGWGGSAGSQRLSVRQLATSMPIVLSGQTWQIGSANGFDTRKSTLGDPDYIAIVDENLEPTPLFMKFMDDAAKDGCTRTVADDAKKPQDARVIARFASSSDTESSNPNAVDQNLRYLKLRFHGVKVTATDDAPIAPLRQLFTSVVNTSTGTAEQKVKEGWRAVCVALLTAPEYHVY